MSAQSTAQKRALEIDDATPSVGHLPAPKKPCVDVAAPTAQDAINAMNQFYRRMDRTYSEMYAYLERCVAGGVKLTQTVSPNNVLHLRRICALVAMMRWLGFGSTAADTIVAALPEELRQLLTDDRAVRQLWTVVYVSHPEADAAWLALCASKRDNLVEACKWTLPPPPPHIARAKLSDANRREISDFVNAMCVRADRKPELVSNATAWIRAFAGELHDESGALAKFVVARNDATLVDCLSKVDTFGRYAIRRTLEDVVQTMQKSASPREEVVWSLVAASVDTALNTDSDGGFYGMASHLFAIALMAKDVPMFTKVATLSTRLGPVIGLSTVVAMLNESNNIACFKQLVQLRHIESRELWPAFVASIKPSSDDAIAMLRTFTKYRKSWCLAQREYVTKTLQARALVRLLCAFAQFVAENSDGSAGVAMVESTFAVVSKCAAEQASSNDVTLCLACADVADHLLPCGHLIACEKCIERLVDPSSCGRSACPKCRTPVDRSKPNWKIKLYK